MKTPEEIKKGLNACTDGVCDICPYKGKGNCGDDCMIDALRLIQQLESRLAQAERERDAAVDVLHDVCSFCKGHALEVSGGCVPDCERCMLKSYR